MFIRIKANHTCLWIPAILTIGGFIVMYAGLVTGYKTSQAFSAPIAFLCAIAFAIVISLQDIVLFIRKGDSIQVITSKDKQLCKILDCRLEILQNKGRKYIILKDAAQNISVNLMGYSYERNEEIFSYLKNEFGFGRESAETIAKKDVSVRKGEFLWGLGLFGLLVLMLIYVILTTPN